MTTRVSMLLKSRASLTCFRACFLPGRAKDLSAPGMLPPHTNAQTLYALRSEGNRPFGRAMCRWEDNDKKGV